MQAGIKRPSPAMVVAVIALILALTGTAFAALGKNSVGSRQLKSKAVTTGKLANNAVNGTKVANGSLTGEDINLGALGTVPTATSAASAGNSNTVGGHAASCPSGTTLIRGLCFDTSAAEAPNLNAAADACAARGGYLPTPMELYSTKNILNLGTGVGTEKQFTDSLYGTVGKGSLERTAVIFGAGQIEEHDVTQPAQYHCVYPLVR